MTQQFITMTITITVKIPVPPAPAGAKAPEPVFLFREGQPPLCRCKVRYGKVPCGSAAFRPPAGNSPLPPSGKQTVQRVRRSFSARLKPGEIL